MMSTYPKSPVVLPTDLACVRNGYLSGPSLAPIGWGAQLHPLAARAWTAMWWNAAMFGLMLTWTHGGAYRAYWQQVALFTQRWDNTKRSTPSVFYGGLQWWLKPGVARAGVPGTSNHGYGLALDLALGEKPDVARSLNSNALGWLLVSAGSFGFTWELDSEPWHVRYVAGDDVPFAVTDTEATMVAASGAGA